MARWTACQKLAICILATLASAGALLLLYRTGRDAARCYPARHTHLPPSKPCAMHGYGWQLPGSTTLYASVWSSETRWGNELSRYWQGRAMARLGGLAFTAVGDFTHAWLRFLPLHVRAGRAPDSCAAFEAACDACVDWKYSHKCLGGWTTLGDEIIADTHAALRKYARRKRGRVSRAMLWIWHQHADSVPPTVTRFAQADARVWAAGCSHTQSLRQGCVVLARRIRARRVQLLPCAPAKHKRCVHTECPALILQQHQLSNHHTHLHMVARRHHLHRGHCQPGERAEGARSVSW